MLILPFFCPLQHCKCSLQRGWRLCDHKLLQINSPRIKNHKRKTIFAPFAQVPRVGVFGRILLGVPMPCRARLAFFLVKVKRTPSMPMTCRSRLAGFFLDKSKTTPSVSMTCRTKAPLLILKQRKKEVKPWSYMSLTRSYWQFSQRENIYLGSSSHSPWDGIAYCVSSWQTKLKGRF